MTIDASAVARVVGISTTYEDLRSGGAPFLPQRIALFAQGETAVSFPLDKFLATSAQQVGSVLGYKSPAYHAARELLPAVGTIPVTVYPMADSGTGVVAVGDITPSGTATAAAAYRYRVGGVLGAEFTIPLGAVDVTRAVAESGKSIAAILGMPVLVTYTYGTIASVADGDNAGDGTVTALSAVGVALPGAYILECTAAVAEGGVFSFTDPDGTVLSTTVTMTPGSGGATVISEGGLQFTITDGVADFEVGDKFTITAPGLTVVLTSAWKGVSANDILLEVIGDTTLGVTFAFTQPVGGLVNPTVDAALLLIGSVWETMVLSTLDDADTTALDAFKVEGEARWGDTVRKPFIVFRGNTEADRATATVVTSARTDDRVNCQLVAPGSPNMPHVVAARQLSLIAKLANNNPPHDYGSQRATGLIPGAESSQWNFVVRDQAVKAGSSTIQLKDGVVNISDVVTHWAPEGEPDPAYRFVVDIIKLQQVIFNVGLKFAIPEWDGAPLIADKQATTNPSAKKPKMAKRELFDVIDALALEAVITNPAEAKKTVTAVLGGPKRLDLGMTIQVSGNTNQIPIAMKWGFDFGG